MFKLRLSAVCGQVLFLLASAAMPAMAAEDAQSKPSAVESGTSYQNDTSLPLFYLPPHVADESWNTVPGREGPKNPRVPNNHVDSVDPIVQHLSGPSPQIPAPLIQFPGIPFPGVGCNCAPPDTNGDVGVTQYLQMVNNGLQVFDKATGTSLMGPIGISAVWAGFGGVCENNGSGDPVVLYDQLANRWLISQFAGASVPTDECIAISTTDDATGTYYRYAFHLGTNFYDYPHLGVWPDGYYMAMNVFNSGGTAFLGPQAFAFDRVAMLAGQPGATFVTPGLDSSSNETYLPADLDGDNLPPLGAPNPFLEYPSDNTYRVRHFHADFVTPANTTFTLFSNPVAAGFTTLCGSTRACVPQLGTADKLDAIGDRLMFRLAYRKFADGHDALVGNFTVDSTSVAGIRWFELRNVIDGPVTVHQQSTYQPDTTWRWLGSTAMDAEGNLALGFSASSAAINPQLRYAGRLATDPLNSLAQGEASLFNGTGSQTGTDSRWGDYSSLNVDPVDDCTFWYTNEYYDTVASFSWKTRIGSFKFDECGTPGFRVNVVPASTAICAGNPASFNVNVTSVALYNSPVTLAASGNPAPTTVGFSPNPVPTLPGSSTMQVLNTASLAAGPYPILVTGTGAGAANDSDTANLSVFVGTPSAASLVAPANAALNQLLRPVFSWSGSNTNSYTIEIATDAAFTNIVISQSLSGTTFTPAADLNSNAKYYWRVSANNPCGAGATSATFSFTTLALPGDCSIGSVPQNLYQYGFESGLNGWTTGSGSIGNTWADNATAHSGTHSWKANDPATVSDQRFVSPAVILPMGQDPLTLQFWNKQDIEASTGSCWDGGILEISTDGGSSWVQLGAPDLLTDPYNGLISASFSNPLASLNAWCGAQDWLNSVVSLGTYAGSTVQFRFRLGSDNSVARDGWYLDDVKVQSCVPAPVTYTVTPAATTNGVINPSTPQTVNAGNTTAFTLTPNSGYVIGTVSGCAGSLTGNTYTTGPVNADCTVTASFDPAPPALAISINDGRSYAAYGMALSYTVTVINAGGVANAVSLSSTLPAQLDASTATWTCDGGTLGTVCAASGTGALNDSGITIPAGGTVNWTVNASVLPNATGGSIAYTVTVDDGSGPVLATDTDGLVLFRAGFEIGDDGSN